MENELKVCRKCGISQPLENFCRRLHRLSPKCRECTKIYNKERYQKHKKTMRVYADKRTARLRQEALEYILPLKRQPCHDCGGTFDPVCMDFDHRNPLEKTNTISWLTRGSYLLETIKEEVAKCDLVCSNCHRIRTHKKREYYKIEGRKKLIGSGNRPTLARAQRFKRRTKYELENNITPEVVAEPKFN